MQIVLAKTIKLRIWAPLNQNLKPYLDLPGVRYVENKSQLIYITFDHTGPLFYQCGIELYKI